MMASPILLLPIEILGLIVCELTIESSKNFRLVSKATNEAIKKPFYTRYLSSLYVRTSRAKDLCRLICIARQRSIAHYVKSVSFELDTKHVFPKVLYIGLWEKFSQCSSIEVFLADICLEGQGSVEVSIQNIFKSIEQSGLWVQRMDISLPILCLRGLQPLLCCVIQNMTTLNLSLVIAKCVQYMQIDFDTLLGSMTTMQNLSISVQPQGLSDKIFWGTARNGLPSTMRSLSLHNVSANAHVYTRIITSVRKTLKAITLKQCNIMWDDWSSCLGAIRDCEQIEEVVLLHLQTHGILVQKHDIAYALGSLDAKVVIRPDLQRQRPGYLLCYY